MTTLTLATRRSFLLHNAGLRAIALVFKGEIEYAYPDVTVLPKNRAVTLTKQGTGRNYLGLVFPETTRKLYIRSRQDTHTYLADCVPCPYRLNYKCMGIVNESPANPNSTCFLHPKTDRIREFHTVVEFPEFIQQFQFDGTSDRLSLYVPGPVNQQGTTMLVSALLTGNVYTSGNVCTGEVNSWFCENDQGCIPAVQVLNRVFNGLHNHDLSLPYTGTLASWFREFKHNANFNSINAAQAKRNWGSCVFQMRVGPYFTFLPEPGEILDKVHVLRDLTDCPEPDAPPLLIETNTRMFDVRAQTSYKKEEITLI